MKNDHMVRNLARTYLLLHRRLDRAMAEQGASLARTKMLLLIQAEGGNARAADVAEMLQLAPRTVTETLDALERDELIERSPDADDRRVKRLAVTPAGAAAIAASEPLRRRLVDEVFSVLDADEYQQLEALLGKLSATLENADLPCRPCGG